MRFHNKKQKEGYAIFLMSDVEASLANIEEVDMLIKKADNTKEVKHLLAFKRELEQDVKNSGSRLARLSDATIDTSVQSRPFLELYTEHKGIDFA